MRAHDVPKHTKIIHLEHVKETLPTTISVLPDKTANTVEVRNNDDAPKDRVFITTNLSVLNPSKGADKVDHEEAKEPHDAPSDIHEKY